MTRNINVDINYSTNLWSWASAMTSIRSIPACTVLCDRDEPKLVNHEVLVCESERWTITSLPCSSSSTSIVVAVFNGVSNYQQLLHVTVRQSATRRRFAFDTRRPATRCVKKTHCCYTASKPVYHKVTRCNLPLITHKASTQRSHTTHITAGGDNCPTHLRDHSRHQQNHKS